MREEELAIVLVVLAVLGGFFALVVMAIGAWVRVGRLERRIAALEALRGAGVGPAGVMPSAPPVVVSPIGVPDVATAPGSAASAAVERAPAAVPGPDRLRHGSGEFAETNATAKGPGLQLPASESPGLPLPVPSPAGPGLPLPPPAARRDKPEDWERVIAGRWLNRIGLIAVAIGMSYFLKYAIDNDWIGPRGQVAIGFLIGAALVASGPAWLKRGYTYFADGMTGLGAAVLYLSAWAAANYHHLISPVAGFVLMSAITASILAIAIARRSQWVAIVALAGGFLTPILMSTGRNAEVELFTYLAVLNAGLLGVARARSWRAIDLPAFVLTQLYFWGWYGRYYEAAAIVPTTIFAAVFFAEFAALPLVRRLNTGQLRVPQALLALANPAMFLLALHQMLWPDHRWTLTVATLGLAAVHLMMARVAPAGSGTAAQARLLFAGIALTCVTLAVPMRLDGPWVTWSWAVEAAVLTWIGFRTLAVHLRTLAMILFAIVIWRLFELDHEASRFLLNARFMTAVVTVASLFVALRLVVQQAAVVGPNERVWWKVLAVLTNVLAVWALTLEVQLYFRPTPEDGLVAHSGLAEGLGISVLWMLCASALLFAGVRASQAALRWQGLALFGLATVKVFLFDLAFLTGFYRIGSSIALGVLLLAVSFVYQRRLASNRPAEES